VEGGNAADMYSLSGTPGKVGKERLAYDRERGGFSFMERKTSVNGK